MYVLAYAHFWVVDKGIILKNEEYSSNLILIYFNDIKKITHQLTY